MTAPAVSVLIPAYNEEASVAETVRAALGLPHVVEAVVVDDGSRDATAARAAAAGARVLRLPRNRGKAAAVRAGWTAAEGDVLLLLDADLGATAARCGALLAPVLAGEAEMSVACLPRTRWRGGFGLAVGLARWGVRALAGRTLRAPLSGQRAVRREVLAAVEWWGRGWGLEVALDVVALRRGFRVVEVEVPLAHRLTGRDVADFAHRGRQFADIAWTLAVLALRERRRGRGIRGA